MMAILTSEMFWIFVILNLVNVLLSTLRSLTTINGGKWIASLMNALCYGYYTIIIVITATYEMPLIVKCFAVAVVNFVGVFAIKFGEQKTKKEKLWIFNVIGIDAKITNKINNALYNANIKFSCYEISKDYWTFNIFSETIKDSELIVAILNKYSIKFYAVETMEKNSK